MAAISLTIKSINGVVYTPFEQLFDSLNMRSTRLDPNNSADTYFDYEGKAFIVDETLTQIKALLAVTSASVGFNAFVWGKFDATAGKAVGTYNLTDPVSGVDISIPNAALITDGFYVVETTFTSSTSAATIALGVATDAAAGLKAAIAINNGANPWNAVAKAALIPVATVATYVGPTTAARAVTATVAVEALTAGVLKVCLKYNVKP